MRLFLAIILSLAAAYALAFYLAIPANPEVRFWRTVIERRNSEITEVRKKQPGTPMIFFTGGSSCAFSIDPAIIEETCGLPAFNLGLPVAAGGKYLLHQALEQTRAGDVLVVCLESDVLATYKETEGPTKFSFAISAAAGHPSESSGGATFKQTPSIRHYLNFARPGAGHLSTLAAKSVSGRDYRYTVSDIRYHGRVETPIQSTGIQTKGASQTTSLSHEGRILLETFVNAAIKRKVKVIYAMPWIFTSEESLALSRHNNSALTQDIGTLIPTLEDGFTGANSNPAFFSDSQLHLTAAGSALRSRALAMPLKQWLSQH